MVLLVDKNIETIVVTIFRMFESERQMRYVKQRHERCKKDPNRTVSDKTRMTKMKNETTHQMGLIADQILQK